MQNISRSQKQGGAIIRGGAIFGGNTVCFYDYAVGDANFD